MNSIIPLITSIVLLSFIFLLSRTIVQDIFTILHRILRKPSLAYRAVAFLFLPGTFVHEVAHYIMAKILFLKVVGFSLWPEWKHNSVRLGSVTYIKRDPIRGILVGVAPVFIGLFTLERLISIFPFPGELNAYALIYILMLFLISTTMFSSKQDLVDLLQILPYLCIVIILLYVIRFDYKSLVPTMKIFLEEFSPYFVRLNNALGITLAVQVIFFLLMKGCRLLLRA